MTSGMSLEVLEDGRVWVFKDPAFDQLLRAVWEVSMAHGWEVVCPDGLVRHYPFHNHGDAEEMASQACERQCRLYPEPSPLELSQPPCPEGVHTVRPVVFEPPDRA